MSEPSYVWHPGHYIYATGDTQIQEGTVTEVTNMVLTREVKTLLESSDFSSKIKGVSIKIKWKNVQTSGVLNNVRAAVFNFDVLNNIVTWCANNNKKLVVEVHDRTWRADQNGGITPSKYPGPEGLDSLFCIAEKPTVAAKDIIPRQWIPAYATHWCHMLRNLGSWFYENETRKNVFAGYVLEEFHVANAETYVVNGSSEISQNLDNFFAFWEATYAAAAESFYEHPVFQAVNWINKAVTDARRRDDAEAVIQQHMNTYKGGLSVPDIISVKKSRPPLPSDCFGPDIEFYNAPASKFGAFFYNLATTAKNSASGPKYPILLQSQMPSMRTTKTALAAETYMNAAAKAFDPPYSHVVHARNTTGAHFFVWFRNTGKTGAECSRLRWDYTDVQAMLRTHYDKFDREAPTNMTSRGSNPNPNPTTFPAPTNVRIEGNALVWAHTGTDLHRFSLTIGTGRDVRVGKAVRRIPLARLGLLEQSYTLSLKAIKNDSARTESTAVTVASLGETAKDPETVCVSATHVLWTPEDGSTPQGFEVQIDSQRLAVTGPTARNVPIGTLTSGEHTVRVRSIFPEGVSAWRSKTWTHPVSGANQCSDAPTPTDPELGCETPSLTRPDCPMPKCGEPLADPPAMLATYWNNHSAIVTRTATTTGKDVAFIGDSITAQWLDSAANQGGVGLWTAHFGSAINLAIGNDRVENVAWRIRGGWRTGTDNTAFGHVGGETKGSWYFRNWTPKPKVLVLMAGVNNLGGSYWPGDTNGPELIRKALFDIADYFVGSVNPNGVVLICQLLTNGNASIMSRVIAVNTVLYGPTHRGSFVPATAAEVRRGGIYVVPTFDLIRGGTSTDPTHNSTLFKDAYHPNTAGFSRLALGRTDAGATPASPAANGLASIVARCKNPTR